MTTSKTCSRRSDEGISTNDKRNLKSPAIEQPQNLTDHSHNFITLIISWTERSKIKTIDFKPASPALWQQVSKHREASGSPHAQNSLTSLGAGESRPSKLPSFPQTCLAPKSTLPLSAVTSRSAKRIELGGYWLAI